jgi:hypothetical protein
VTRFAAAPHQRAASPRLVSSLFPQLPRASMRGFHAALLGGAAAVAALAALRLFPAALVGGALLLPTLTIAYCYTVDVYERQPLFAVVFTGVWGAACGAGIGFLARAVAPTGADLIDRTSTAHVVTGGVVLPVVGVVLTLAGPLVLLPYRRYNDVLDGATFGAVSAASFASAEVVVYGVHMFDRGLRPVGEAWPWVVRVLAIAVAQPVLTMGAVGFAAAALWLRYRASPVERRALGALGHPGLAVPLAVALVVAGAVTEPLLPGGAWLASLAVLDAAALVLLRRAIHVGLSQEAAESLAGPPYACSNCGATVPRGPVCSSCGISVRALPKVRDRDAVRGAFDGRLSRRGAMVAFGVALAAFVAAAAAAAALLAPPAPEPLCRPYEPCGRPPVAVAQLRNGRVWRSPALGFAVEYSADRWRVDGEAPDGVTLTTSNPAGTLTLRGRRGSPRGLLDDELSALGRSFVGFTRDTVPADELLGTGVGLRPGPGGAYVGTRAAPQGWAVQESVAVMAAGEGTLSVVATVSTGVASPDGRSYVYRLADQVLKSVAWPSDLRSSP